MGIRSCCDRTSCLARPPQLLHQHRLGNSMPETSSHRAFPAVISVPCADFCKAEGTWRLSSCYDQRVCNAAALKRVPGHLLDNLATCGIEAKPDNNTPTHPGRESILVVSHEVKLRSKQQTASMKRLISIPEPLIFKDNICSQAKQQDNSTPHLVCLIMRSRVLSHARGHE